MRRRRRDLIREVLPTGWGDTYYQSVGGQAFDITDLPNGRYYIEVRANPLGLLYDRSAANDVRLREIRLRGRPGHRRVVVPPWHGIRRVAAAVVSAPPPMVVAPCAPVPPPTGRFTPWV